MNNNYKYLVWAGTAVLVVLVFFLLASTDHIINSATNTNTVSFNGEGRVSIKPDLAAISFSIVTEAVTSKAAQDANTLRSNKVVDFLKAQGVEDKDIKTTGYNVYPQYSYPQPIPMMLDSRTQTAPSGTSGSAVPEYYPSNPKITGYQVIQSFEVKVRNLTKVSSLLDGLVTQGANQVNNLGFTVDDIEKIKDQAREKAIADAKDKANNLRKQLGIRLGKIVNYYEGGNYPMYAFDKAAVGMGGGAPSLPSIPVGENEIVINVTITYQIK